MNLFARLVREPLLQFSVIGIAIFIIYTALQPPEQQQANSIIVTPQRIAQLKQGYQAVWNRPPTDEQTAALIDNFVKEEVFYREARALGLDRNDTVIRQRLRQKMEFLTSTGADLLKPDEQGLKAYFTANKDTYKRQPRVAFDQVFLGEAPSQKDVSELLLALQSKPQADFSVLGMRTLLPPRTQLSTPATIGNVFGQDLFEQLDTIAPDIWSGPVKSSYGYHLVRIIENIPASYPALSEVRDIVVRDWLRAKTEELRELNFQLLREKYVVEILEEPAPEQNQ